MKPKEKRLRGVFIVNKLGTARDFDALKSEISRDLGEYRNEDELFVELEKEINEMIKKKNGTTFASKGRSEIIKKAIKEKLNERRNIFI